MQSSALKFRASLYADTLVILLFGETVDHMLRAAGPCIHQGRLLEQATQPTGLLLSLVNVDAGFLVHWWIACSGPGQSKEVRRAFFASSLARLESQQQARVRRTSAAQVCQLILNDASEWIAAGNSDITSLVCLL